MLVMKISIWRLILRLEGLMENLGQGWYGIATKLADNPCFQQVKRVAPTFSVPNNSCQLLPTFANNCQLLYQQLPTIANFCQLHLLGLVVSGPSPRGFLGGRIKDLIWIPYHPKEKLNICGSRKKITLKFIFRSQNLIFNLVN